MFAERLKQIRKTNKVTQVQLAKDFNVSQGTVGNWETGKREPDFNTIKKLAEYFNVTIDFLLGRENTIASDEISESELKDLVADLPEEAKEYIKKIVEVYSKLTPENRQHYIDLANLELDYQEKLNAKKNPSKN